MKQRLAVFFGGKACEHDISIVTGQQLIENVDKARYDVIPVYIARDGIWYSGESLLNMDFMRKFDAQAKGVFPVSLSALPNGRGLIVESEKSGIFAKKSEPIAFDVAILAMHGLNGEDGSIQGLLELAEIPYSSPGVLGSAAGMDKILMKTTFKGAGIPVLPGLCVLRDEWEAGPDEVIGKIEAELDYPLMIKPANLGSSIGITKADDRDGLYEAVEIAIRYDRRILIEKAVKDLAEYNCSAMGFGSDVRVSLCEQPLSWESFLSFEDKYMRDSSGKNSGMDSMGRLLPAPISDELTAQIQGYTKQIFMLFDCKGVVRIDYIYDKVDEKLYVNEINTIPGSFAFYLWEPLGISFSQMIDQMVFYAQQADKEKKRNVFAYSSEVLSKAQIGAKGAKSKTK